MINLFKIDVQINKNLHNYDSWNRIIDRWIQNNIDYLLENDFKDAAYWHNEMANISCLVGAIWKIGGVAISEYTINKDTYNDQNNIISSGQNNNGPADLYFSINKTKYLVESKYIRNQTITIQKVKDTMEIAVKDCRNCNEKELNNKMAMIFASPISSKCSLNLNDKDLDYDIKVMLKIIGKNKPLYKNKIYDTVYLFAQHVKSQS